MSSLPVWFLKDLCKQCNSPLSISSISLEICQIFSQYNVIISNPFIFLTKIQFHANHMPYYGVWFRIANRVIYHSNETLFWHVKTTWMVFSLMAALLYICLDVLFKFIIYLILSHVFVFCNILFLIQTKIRLQVKHKVCNIYTYKYKEKKLKNRIKIK